MERSVPNRHGERYWDGWYGVSTMPGKRVLMAMGVAFALWSVTLQGEEYRPRVPGDTRVYYGYDDRGLVSLRKNAVVSIGGELRVDYVYREMRTSGREQGISIKTADLAIKNANLRINADVHPNVRAIFKLDLSSNSDPSRDRDEIIEEAIIVMRAVGGLEFFAGKGRAPYGQDVTLGMLQSYHHAANRADSSEGRVFIIDPPDAAKPNDPDAPPLAPMRPGQFDRTFMAGAAYQWNERWRVEIAAFQPNSYEYRHRLRKWDDYRGGAEIGVAARLWWRPVEELTLQASGIFSRSNEMGHVDKRLDVGGTAKGRDSAYAFSAGFDWRTGPWQVFGEYQHGWDWNFTDGYHTDTWQLGGARDIADAWRVGAMVEGMRISDHQGGNVIDNYYKIALNIRYTFSSGLYVLGEYGHEWFKRRHENEANERRKGDYFGVRFAFSF